MRRENEARTRLYGSLAAARRTAEDSRAVLERSRRVASAAGFRVPGASAGRPLVDRET